MKTWNKHSTRKKILVFLLCLGVIGVFLKIYNKGCIGGKWTVEPFTQESFCNKKYSDGGNQCTDGNQCQSGRCLSASYDIIDGRCAKYETVFGCYSLIINGQSLESACYN